MRIIVDVKKTNIPRRLPDGNSNGKKYKHKISLDRIRTLCIEERECGKSQVPNWDEK